VADASPLGVGVTEGSRPRELSSEERVGREARRCSPRKESSIEKIEGSWMRGLPERMEDCSPEFVGALSPSQAELSKERSVGRARFGRGDWAGEAGRLSGRGEDSDSAEVTDDMLEPLK
jgi:hypothetical protein